MKINKMIMSNGNEYTLLWDESANVSHSMEGSVKMIDIEKGWVELNSEFISEIFYVGKLDNMTKVSVKARKQIEEHYGPEVFKEEEPQSFW